MGIQMEKVCNTPSIDIVSLSDYSFFVLEELSNDGVVHTQEIVQYKIRFSDIERVVLHSEYVNNERIINFNVDSEANKLVVYSQMPKLKEGYNFKCTIFDLFKSKILFEQLVTNTELHGRLESGLYTLIDGHIYYNNQVIKIRYDLIEHAQGNIYNEEQIFDYYGNIFTLEDGEKVSANFPMDSRCMNKLVYIIKSPSKFKVSRFMVLPYLHENRIYLNRKKVNTEYFYTAIDPECPVYFKNLYGQALFNKYQRQKSIMCMNLSESKYYIYSERGILRNRIDFKAITNQDGKISAVS